MKKKIILVTACLLFMLSIVTACKKEPTFSDKVNNAAEAVGDLFK